MARFLFGWDYRSNLGAGTKGEAVDLESDVADAINRDSPGVLTPEVVAPALVDDEADTRALDAPPSDRMQRTRNDRGAQSPIDKTTAKAVRE